MKVELLIADDAELRKAIKELIKAEVLSLARSEVVNILREVVGDRVAGEEKVTGLMWERIKKWFEEEKWETIQKKPMVLEAYSPLLGKMPTAKGWVILKQSNKGRMKAYYVTLETERELNLDWAKAELGVE